MSIALVRFKKLIGLPTTEVITIMLIDVASGTNKGTTFAGATVVVKGTSIFVDQNALVRDGDIIREMPSLTVTEVGV